jgi:hypothetical protein
MLGALLLATALIGCGGSESSQVAGGAPVSGKALKAEEVSDGSVQADSTEGSDQANASEFGQVNSLDTIVADMRERNDFVLRGYEGEAYGWYVGPGETLMGNNPTFRNSDFWSAFGNNSSYIGSTANAMLPWLAVFDGVNHAAANVAVEFRNMRVYVKSRSSGQWDLLGGPSKATGINYGKPGTGLGPQDETVIASSGTASTIMMGSDSRYFWHGWWDENKKSINPYDIGAFFITIQARLAVGNSGSDERANAELGLQVGADYYLETSTEYGETAPAIGISRTKKLTNEWQAFSYTTFSDVGAQVPGGGITEAEFRSAPPPLE